MLIVIFTMVEIGKKPKFPLIDDWRKEGSQLKKKCYQGLVWLKRLLIPTIPVEERNKLETDYNEGGMIGSHRNESQRKQSPAIC